MPPQSGYTQEVPSGDDNPPDGQAAQDVAPAALEYHDPTQLTHAVLGSVSSSIWPGTHAAHAAEPGGEYSPVAHALHVVDAGIDAY